MSAFEHILALIFPPRCPACGQVAPRVDVLCATCEQKARRVPRPRCARCGQEAARCACREGELFEFDALVAPFYYDGAIGDSIRRMKFRQDPGIARFLGSEMARELKQERPDFRADLIVCVPLSPKGLRERGYNQCDLISSALKAKTGWLFDSKALTKPVENKTQHSLGRALRFKNIRGVFTADAARVRGKRLLLIDDVSTTGATLDECARILKKAGAESVVCLTAAVVEYSGVRT